MISLQTIESRFNCERSCPANRQHWCKFNALFRLIGFVRVHSHTATVKTEYDPKHPECLEAAVRSLGGQWIGFGEHSLGDTRQTGYGFKLTMSGSVRGDNLWYHPIVLRMDGQLAYDEYGGRWGDVNGLEKLKGAYAIAKAELAAQALGWMTERTADGSLVVYHPQSGTITITKDAAMDASGFLGAGCHAAVEALGIQTENVQLKSVGCEVRATVGVSE